MIPVFAVLQPAQMNFQLFRVFFFGIGMQVGLCALKAHRQTKMLPTLSSVPEEGLGRNGVDEPLEQLARSLPAVVDFCQVGQQHF